MLSLSVMKEKIDRMNALKKELIKASADYYNGIESMSNFEYDKKFDELKVLEEDLRIKDRFTDKVGSKTDKLNKVTHEYQAKSLGKTKSVDELIKEQSKNPLGDKGYSCLSWKLDGLTVQLTYNNGRLILASTRGDGLVGQDITLNAKRIKGIPPTIAYKGKMVVRGEAIMSYENFDKVNVDGQFANPRNLASATVTALDPELLKEREINFKAFELVRAEDYEETDRYSNVSVHSGKWLNNSYSSALDYLADNGFDVVEHKRIKIEDIKTYIEEWSKPERIKALGLPVDGLVICNDNRELVKDMPDTEHHPNLTKGMAFKWADETVQTTLRAIEWSASRTGLLNPVAVFDTVDLCGTKVSRASVHNLSVMEGLDLKIGDRISVFKANMIIPQIAENLDKGKDINVKIHKPNCPCCKTQSIIKDNKGIKTVECPNEECPAKTLGKFTHFVSKHGMNIEGLSENTLDFMLNKGYIRTFEDLYTLKDDNGLIEHLKNEEGFGDKSVDNLLKSIEKSRKTNFEHFMYAVGIEGFGRGQIKVLKDYIEQNYDNELSEYHNENGEYDLMATLVMMKADNYDFTKIDGIGNVLADNLCNFIDQYLIKPYENCLDYNDKQCVVVNVLKELQFEDTHKVINKDLVNNNINGKTFVITGSLNNYANRDELVKEIELNGGKVASSVSAKTDYLINNDVNSTSSKNKKANDLGIPIISETDYINLRMDGLTKEFDTLDERE